MATVADGPANTAAFDVGKSFTYHYDEASAALPRASLILFYVYLLWFRGLWPHAVEHSVLDYLALAFGAIMAWDFAVGFYHLCAWLRLEHIGVQYGYSSAGAAGGLYRISLRLADGRAVLDPLGRAQRLSIEITTRAVRDRQFNRSTWAIMAAAAAYVLTSRAPYPIGAAVALGIVAPCLAWYLRCFFGALSYKLGAQYIPGARVLDPEIARAGVADVVAQKVHGDARIAAEDEANEILNGSDDLLPADNSDIYLGCYNRQDTKEPGRPLAYAGERHLVLFGPNGCGKGSSVLIPNLLRSERRSLVVLDPKGELAAVTARHRRTLGDVVILNPFATLRIPGQGFNPLALLDPDDDNFFDDAVGIGEALITIDEHEKHWSESAQGLLVALVMWEAKLARKEGRVPRLENVRFLMTEPARYADDGGGRRQVSGLQVTIRRMCEAGDPRIASLAGRFASENEEIASIQSTADRQTTWMLSPPVARSLTTNAIDFRSLKRRPTTVYVILPAERMRTHAVWLRLVIVTALRALYSPGGLPALFMLDEFAQLGHLSVIEDVFGLVRGYGIQLWPILQDLNQLKGLYEKKWETMIGNAGIVMGFAPNDMTTAEWMSKRAGDTTVIASGYNEGGSTGARGPSASEGMNYQQAKRPLFLPQELIGMDKGTGIVWGAGSEVSVLFRNPDYRQDAQFAGRFDPNPYYQQKSDS